MLDTIDFPGAFDRIESSVESAYREAGWEMAAELRLLLSVPVEYRIVGRFVKVTRSLPGEAPRREFGGLQASIDFDASRIEGSGARLDVFSTSMISVYLQYGTSTIAPRPHWNVVLDSWSDRFAPLTAAAVASTH